GTSAPAPAARRARAAHRPRMWRGRDTRAGRERARAVYSSRAGSAAATISSLGSFPVEWHAAGAPATVQPASRSGTRTSHGAGGGGTVVLRPAERCTRMKSPRSHSRTRLKMTEIRPDLPAPLSPLRGLARNLRWAWHAPTRALFERLDQSLWEGTRHNPVRLLWEVAPARLDAVVADTSYLEAVNAAAADLEAYLRDDATWFRRTHPAVKSRIAYFSAEFGIAECLRIYSGGLGVLAGDHLKSASDLGVPLVGVGLMYREGYFTQRIDAVGVQHDVYERADLERVPIALELGADGQPLTVDLPFLDHRIHARIWRADVGRVPLYLLDTDLDSNSA